MEIFIFVVFVLIVFCMLFFPKSTTKKDREKWINDHSDWY